MRPGDILFIPPLWLHTASPTGQVSVAVNVSFAISRTGMPPVGMSTNPDMQAYEESWNDLQIDDQVTRGASD